MILNSHQFSSEDKIDKSNSKQFLEEMSESTIHSPDDNTVNLSLPDSFDETLTINGMQILDNFGKESQQENLQPSKASQQRFNNKNESYNVKSNWIEEEKNRILSLAGNSPGLCGGFEYNYERLKFLPKERMTLMDAAAMVIQTRVTKLSGAHRQEVNRLRDQIENLEHELGEVKRSKKALAQRFESLESELIVSNGEKQELNSKMREFHEQTLQYKVIERDYEAMKLKLKATDDAKDVLHRRVELLEKTLDEATSAGRETLQKLGESERKVQSMITERALLQKETDLILERAERLEKDVHQSEGRLSAMRSEYGDAMRKANIAQERAKADWEAKFAQEMSRVRQESGNDVSQLFKHRIDVWERENMLLRESKKELQNELEQLKRELLGARETYDTQMAQNLKTLSEKEREIIEVRYVIYASLHNSIWFHIMVYAPEVINLSPDCMFAMLVNRSQLTIKSFEISNLISTQDTMSSEQGRLTQQNENLRNVLASQEREYIKMEHECKAERKNLLNELERKQEQLNEYLYAEKQAEMEIASGKDPGKVGQLPDPRRLVQHCLDLARKVGELQKVEETLRIDIVNLKKENEQLQGIKKSYEQLVAASNQPMGSILTTLKEKTYENQHLRAEIKRYKDETQRLTSDKVKFKKEVSNFVQKTKKLEEMVKAFQALQTSCSETADVQREKRCENSKQELLSSKNRKNATGVREHEVSSIQSCITGKGATDVSIHLVHRKDRHDVR